MRGGLDWRGLAAVLTVAGVFTVLIIASVNGARNPDYTVSTEDIATVSTVLGAAIGAVAGYMGARQNTPPAAPPSPPEHDRGPEQASTPGPAPGPENRSQGDDAPP